MIPEKTGSKQTKTQFKPGQSGNIKGRPKGSRNKLGEAFIADLHADWLENGAAVIASVRAEKPDAYLKVVAGILPRELKIETTNDLSDSELDARIRQLAEIIGVEVGIIGASDGEEVSSGQESTGKIPPLH